jgi:uncharacterized protein (DUF305 family)
VTRRIAAVVVAVVATTAGACRSAPVEPAPPILRPGRPGEPTREIAAGSALSQPQHTAADVRFMQGMIGHHAQALDMTALVPSRSRGEGIRKLARRIELSQADEIEMMQEWLKGRGEKLPDPHAHHAPGATLMPGMLTADEMARLAAANGAEFDRLFLASMIEHHEGALIMVRDLFATAGAGQEAEIFAFASDVEADQLIEIRRMSAMLEELQK